MNYINESEQFVRYSIRYQLLLAQNVAEICKTNIYVFEQDDFFETDTTVEMVEGTRTIVKDGYRAILSIVVKQVLKNEDQFLYFADKDVLGKDPMGLFVPHVKSVLNTDSSLSDERRPILEGSGKDEVGETKDNENPTDSSLRDDRRQIPNGSGTDSSRTRSILVANLDDANFADISELTDTMVKLEPYI